MTEKSQIQTRSFFRITCIIFFILVGFGNCFAQFDTISISVPKKADKEQWEKCLKPIVRFREKDDRLDIIVQSDAVMTIAHRYRYRSTYEIMDSGTMLDSLAMLFDSTHNQHTRNPFDLSRQSDSVLEVVTADTRRHVANIKQRDDFIDSLLSPAESFEIQEKSAKRIVAQTQPYGKGNTFVSSVSFIIITIELHNDNIEIHVNNSGEKVIYIFRLKRIREKLFGAKLIGTKGR